MVAQVSCEATKDLITLVLCILVLSRWRQLTPFSTTNNHQCSSNSLLYCFSQAHTLYNAVFVRKPNEENWSEKAFQLQQMYWSGEDNSATSTFSYGEQKQLTLELKTQLQSIRDRFRTETKQVDTLVCQFREEEINDHIREEFYERMEGISLKCSGEMRKFAG